MSNAGDISFSSCVVLVEDPATLAYSVPSTSYLYQLSLLHVTGLSLVVMFHPVGGSSPSGPQELLKSSFSISVTHTVSSPLT